MAEFCKQCSEALFNKDFGDLKGLIPQEDLDKGLIYSTVLCEGCGPIQVDNEGTCVSPDCLSFHGEKKDD